ncbi:MAG: peptide chain release factor N(5)-glutamine methyltransferase [Candidatus Gracilibacteria bacterium]|jgi:release factor glutamine methyltransferase|nr:peptide chain release factor N(5)-glutamine methyltransferase [Candidatus Gracilibacteria bacterium]
MTVSQLLNEAFSLLGNDKMLEAELALTHALGVDKVFLIVNKDLDVSEGEVSVFRSYLQRLVEGEPISYITNQREFYGFDFFVDKRVLVPRQETEEIVDRAVAFFRANTRGKKVYKVLDVGTGSGNIAIAVAKTLDDMPVFFDAVDISDDAVEVARLNVAQHNLEDKVDVYESNLLSNVPGDKHYDVILANLPYIGTKEHNFVEENVKKFEPNNALFAGETGLELYEDLFLGLLEKNITFDLMIGEFGFSQGEIVRELLDKYFEKQYKIVKDLAGIERIFLIKGYER